MLRLIRFTILFVSVFSEVHVTASEVGKASGELAQVEKGLQFPEGCLDASEYPCALRSSVSKWKLELGTLKVVLKESATVIWKDERNFQVVSGDVWFAASDRESVRIQSEFGYFENGDSELNVFVRKDSQLMEIYPLTQGVKVFPLGLSSKNGLLLPVGYRSFLSSVGSHGVAKYEIPVATNLKGLIESWAPMFDGTAQELAGFLTEYRKKWVDAVESGSLLHQEMAKREIASERERRARRDRWLKAKREEERYLKKLYRQKNYLDQ